MSRVLNIYLFRHGITDWNQQQILQGHSDIPLNAEGREQALHLRNELPLDKIERVYASDLSRAIETAQIATDNRFTIHQDPRLREAFLGSLEGQKREVAIATSGEDLWNKWQSYDAKDWGTTLPGPSESKQQVLDRTLAFLSDLQARPESTVAICSHGVLIRTLMAHLGQAYEKPIGNCECRWIQLPAQSPPKKPA